MAIDTEDKRASAPNHFLFNILPVPDGSVNASDRSQFSIYCGIITSSAVGFLVFVWKRTV